MPRSTTETALLSSVLALQLDFIGADALADALRIWTQDRDRSLADLLALSPADRGLLESLTVAHLRHHRNDPLRSLAALISPGDIPPALARIEDDELRKVLDRLDRGGPSARTESPILRTVDVPTAGDAPTVAAEAGESGRHPRSDRGPSARYRILRRHARGGLGEIFVALDSELSREVALKEMQAQHLEHPESRQRFLLEGEVTGRLEHPGIVPVYGLGIYPDGRPFYVMRFIRGESLATAISHFHAGTSASPGERALELRKLLARFVEVCNAIAYAHSRGVLHRDLKPDNIMLGEYGETLVVDWGLARVSRTSAGDDGPVNGGSETASETGEVLLPLASEHSTQSLMGLVIGTPQYMSPEQASGRIDLLGPASDIYSLGATLYSILTGDRPFPIEPDIVRVLCLVQGGAFPPPREVNAAVPKPLEAVCLKAMALKREDRYGSTRELAVDVERWLADEPVSSYREPVAVRVRRWARRHRTTVTAGTVLCVTALVAFTIGYFLLNDAIHSRALTQVDALLEANPRAVPALLEGLEPLRRHVRPRLREVRNRPDPSDESELALHRRHQTRASLALLAEDRAEVDFLRDRLLDPELDPEECLLLREALVPHRDAIVGALWDTVDRTGVSPERRFRALVALAKFDAENERWEECGEMAVRPLVESDPLHVGIWARALLPVRKHLEGPLSEVFSDPLLPAERRVAATVLREYAAGNLELLVDLLAVGNDAQVVLLLPRLQAESPEVRAAVRRALEKAGQALTAETKEAKRDTQAHRQANLAAVLLHLGDPDPAWALLRHTAHPDARTHLIHRLAPLEINPDLLVQKLEDENDAGARRGIVLALGSYTNEQLSPEVRARLIPRLLEWYREHPDPGLHSAIDWLLRHGQEGDFRRKLSWDHAEALDEIIAGRKGRPPGKRRWYVAPHGQTMILLGPATFDMGAPETEEERESDEPLHRRRIGRTFAISDREVTVRLFKQFLDETGWKGHRYNRKYSPEDDCPMVMVTWFEAAAFCRWLSDREGLEEKQMCFPPVATLQQYADPQKQPKEPLKLPPDYLTRTGYRLPTEAEWEYACRAGAATSRPHGVSKEMMAHYAWDVHNALAQTWPVGQKKPNDFGLFDMHGNVAEWCFDLDGDYPVARNGTPVEDVEMVKEVKSDSHMILRGAPFHPRPTPLRSAYRYWHLASDRFSTVGLRVVRTWR